MLRTGQLLGPAPNPASRPRTGASLPGTLASPRTGLTPAGCPQLVDWLRHHNLLVVMAPNLLDAPPDRRSGGIGTPVLGTIDILKKAPESCRPLPKPLGHAAVTAGRSA